MSDHDKQKHLRKIINDCRTGMMVTRSATGSMHARPMANVEISEAFDYIWFATSRTSAKTAELLADDRVLLTYMNSSGTEWASINGHTRTVDDRQKIHELWSPFWKNWFTGPDDPNLILLQVTPETAEYWDSGNKVVAMAKFALGALAGKNLLEGDNQKLSLQ
ncbi:MAG TPA: pyridoxamine 5'-phosphate oxidase family protein [Tepidisphaeraceae bacterium]|jgi:general stress protein 26|nr:pyridoxamine 5'-phosphate oxidase family protein [Tepidisphaeraceae bacterium]